MAAPAPSSLLLHERTSSLGAARRTVAGRAASSRVKLASTVLSGVLACEFFFGLHHPASTIVVFGLQVKAVKTPATSEKSQEHYQDQSSSHEMLWSYRGAGNHFHMDGPFPLVTHKLKRKNTTSSGTTTSSTTPNASGGAPGEYEFSLSSEAISMLQKWPGPFYVAAVHGTFRSGKSTLLTLLAREMAGAHYYQSGRGSPRAGSGGGSGTA
ncbi:unnamed protein product, partial [Amoebophrya sp. A120]|eukprot:GSA120T00007025001.1